MGAFAAGGHITRPTLALLGEGGEDEWVLNRRQMRAMLGRRAGSGGGGLSVNIGSIGAGMSPEDVGQMVKVLTIHEYQRMLTESGAAQALTRNVVRRGL